jgi:excisionase family DNA binding protein
LFDKTLVSFISNSRIVVLQIVTVNAHCLTVREPRFARQSPSKLFQNFRFEEQRPKTMITLPDSLDTVSPDDVDQKQVTESSRQLAHLLSGKRKKSLRVTIDGEDCEIPMAALRMLKDLLVQLSLGHSVTLMPIHAELTTQEAADLLSVSRPYLVSLLESGKLAFHKAGTHRRVVLKDLLAYKKQQEQDSDVAMAELAKEAQELGLGYDL